MGIWGGVEGSRREPGQLLQLRAATPSFFTPSSPRPLPQRPPPRAAGRRTHEPCKGANCIQPGSSASRSAAFGGVGRLGTTAKARGRGWKPTTPRTQRLASLRQELDLHVPGAGLHVRGRPRRCVSFLRLRWSWLPRRGEQVAGRRTRSWHSLAASPHPPEPGGRWAIGPPSGRGDAPGGGRDRRPRQVRVASRDNEGPVASGSGDGGSTFTLDAQESA